MYNILALIWRLIPRTGRWCLLWLINPKVIVGVSGVLLNEKNQILLLRHRFHPEYPWGLPGGLLKRGERLAEGWQREVREETNYQIVVDSIVAQFSTVFSLEFILKGRVVGGEKRLDGREVLDAQFFSSDALPAGVHPDHLEAIRLAVEHEKQLVPLPRSDRRPLTSEPIL